MRSVPGPSPGSHRPPEQGDHKGRPHVALAPARIRLAADRLAAARSLGTRPPVPAFGTGHDLTCCLEIIGKSVLIFLRPDRHSFGHSRAKMGRHHDRPHSCHSPRDAYVSALSCCPNSWRLGSFSRPGPRGPMSFVVGNSIHCHSSTPASAVKQRQVAVGRF